MVLFVYGDGYLFFGGVVKESGNFFGGVWFGVVGFVLDYGVEVVEDVMW